MFVSVGERQVAKKKIIQLENAKERVEKWEFLSPSTSYYREGHRELCNISEKVYKLSMTGLKKFCAWPTSEIQEGLNVAPHMGEGVTHSYFTRYSPASGRGESKLAASITRTNENAELTATSASSPLFKISDRS
jgi:hypothetical protein